MRHKDITYKPNIKNIILLFILNYHELIILRNFFIAYKCELN